MKVIVNLFGVDVRLKQEIFVEPSTPDLKGVVRGLKDQKMSELERFIDDRLSPVGGSVVLVNGRNFLSLDGWETGIREGDELTFMVPVAGG
ncbi:MAG: MoaD/ThiS family protein [Deltaproteobacteria bacterium]|nr:MoaD/ThiS family protein [Deltaproteobacteria bacterium]